MKVRSRGVEEAAGEERNRRGGSTLVRIFVKTFQKTIFDTIIYNKNILVDL